MDFSFDNTRPIYLQLAERLGQYIISGQFSPGTKIPSVRDLAAIAQVNPNTVQRALQDLEDRRLIITKRTNGKFVTDDIDHIHHCRVHLAESKIQTFLSEMYTLGLSCSDLINFLQILSSKDQNE